MSVQWVWVYDSVLRTAMRAARRPARSCSCLNFVWNAILGASNMPQFRTDRLQSCKTYSQNNESLFLGCVTRPHPQRQVTQPMKSLISGLCTLKAGANATITDFCFVCCFLIRPHFLQAMGKSAATIFSGSLSPNPTDWFARFLLLIMDSTRAPRMHQKCKIHFFFMVAVKYLCRVFCCFWLICFTKVIMYIE